MSRSQELLCETVSAMLLELQSDSERKDALATMTYSICVECGSKYLPCYCTNDE